MAQESSSPLLLACARTMLDTLDKARSADPVFPATGEKAELLRSLTRAEAALTSLRLQVLAVADDLAAESGARDAAEWCAADLHLDFHEARADLRLAQALDQRWQQVGAALASGGCTTAQARVIVHALQELPSGVDPEDAGKAEAVLLGHASRFKPRELRRLGARILEVIDPETAEAELGRRLQAEEERAARKTSLTVLDAGDGTVVLKARLPKPTGVRLSTYLEAFTQPRLAHLAGQGRVVPYDRLRGQAFCQLLERYDADQFPHHGGDATAVVITMTTDQLNTGLATAAIGVDAEMSAAEARRLACSARLIPAVLGSTGEVLDLGRTARLFTPAQRKALRLRYKICAAEGCSVPAAWTDAHHLDPWSTGGPTDLSNGVPCVVTTTAEPMTPATT